MNWGLLSEYRSQLMGCAILLIMGYHTGLISEGSIGVEWFFILSGIGLYQSLSKKTNVGNFYWKRIIRIMPTYLFLVLPMAFLFREKLPSNVINTVFQIDTIGGWMGFLSYWFIVLLLFFYLISPFLFKYMSIWFGVLASAVLFTIMFTMGFNWFPLNNIFLCRLPVLLMAFPIGKLVYDRTTICKTERGIFLFLVLLFFSLTFIFLLVVGFVKEGSMKMLVYWVLSPILMLVFSKLFDFIKLEWLNKMLGFIGTITLELYLVHEYLCKEIASMLCHNWFIDALLSIVIAIPAAYLLKKLMDRLLVFIVVKNDRSKT